MTPQPTLLPFDLAKALPAGYGVLRREWLAENNLPDGARWGDDYRKKWAGTMLVGGLLKNEALNNFTYAAPLDSAPPEAFLADSAQEAGAGTTELVEIGSQSVDGTSQRDPNYDDELKAAREENAALRAELEREREDSNVISEGPDLRDAIARAMQREEKP